jgi:hypothetical protein
LNDSVNRGTLTNASQRLLGNHSLKLPAWPLKILAILASVAVPLWVFHPRWGVRLMADVQIVGLGVLALIPNRWLVFSRISFVPFLLLTLFPLHELFRVSTYGDVDPGLVVVAILVASFGYLPLPLSLVPSRMRYQSGERFTFA